MLEPIDIVVLMGIYTDPQRSPLSPDYSQNLLYSRKDNYWRSWTMQGELSSILGPECLHQSIEKLKYSRFLIGTPPRIPRHALKALIAAIPYIYPGKVGASGTGLPTAHSAEPLSQLLPYGPTYVWPCPERLSLTQQVQGRCVSPLDESVVDISIKNKLFYKFMSLIETLRVGEGREIIIARDYIEQMLEPSHART